MGAHLNKLAKWLSEQGLSQIEFSRIADVPAPQISLYVTGKRSPGLDNALKIARATDGGVPAEYWTRRRKKHRAA